MNVVKKGKDAAGRLLLPLARSWLRHAPVRLGKPVLWRHFGWRGVDYTCRTRGGIVMAGNSDDLVQKFIYFFGAWEPDVTAAILGELAPGDGLIDVGANVGYYALHGAQRVGPAGFVVAIEASPQTFEKLRTNVALNGFGNVRSVNVAASESDGELELFQADRWNSGASSTVARVGKPVRVRSQRLANILSADELRRAKLVKIDVEGAELSVLIGLESALSSMRKDVVFVVEISEDLAPAGFESIRAVFDWMHRHGFAGSLIRNEYEPSSYFTRPAPVPPQKLELPTSPFKGDVLFRRA